ncbi:MAG: T9SS type A sorting domain-containing protein, partial [Bacteroidales bacterium]|nr:T9SS type A sorting domain-containing protein [Bacteroidales bacterium]
FLVSEEPFWPVPNIFFGDYNNIVAHDNVIRPVWTRLHNNQLSIWTAIVDPDMVGVEETPESTTPFSTLTSYPNPFTETAWLSYRLRSAAPVFLAVYDQLGRIVEVIENNPNQPAGKYTYQFNASAGNYAPGIYYFSLVSGDKVMHQKIVLTR